MTEPTEQQVDAALGAYQAASTVIDRRSKQTYTTSFIPEQHQTAMRAAVRAALLVGEEVPQ